MTILKRAVRKLQRSVDRSLKLNRLGREQSPLAAAISSSIRATLDRSLTPEESTWCDRIEEVRTQMNASTERVTMMDYGAGMPDSNRTVEEMQAGIEVSKILGQVSQISSKTPLWCCLLFKLIRNARFNSCIEMGTSVGISAAYQAAALKLNGQGSLLTLDGSTALAGIARKNHQQLGLDTVDVVVGRFQDTLPQVLKDRQPVDYVFIDGHHDEQATLAYFKQILPSLAEKALLVFDDIAWSEGMIRAWKAIARDVRVSIAVDLGPVGLCVIDGSFSGHRNYEIPLE